AAAAGEHWWSLMGPPVARSLEHQMLEQVREAGPAGLLVLRADVIPERQVHDRRRVIFEEDHLQPVRQRAHGVVEFGWADDRVRRRRAREQQDDARERTRTNGQSA